MADPCQSKDLTKGRVQHSHGWGRSVRFSLLILTVNILIAENKQLLNSCWMARSTVITFNLVQSSSCRLRAGRVIVLLFFQCGNIFRSLGLITQTETNNCRDCRDICLSVYIIFFLLLSQPWAQGLSYCVLLLQHC